MSVLMTIVLIVQMLAAVAMIGLILIQQGKGADAGAGFGGGAASGTLFGATGGANFLSRTTAIMATIFIVCTLALSYFGTAGRSTKSNSVLDAVGQQAPAAAVPAPAAVPASGAAQIPVK